MFEMGMYLSVIYCLFYVKDISMDMLEEYVLEERDPYLKEKEDTRMEDSTEENWGDVADDVKVKINIYALR